MSYLVDTNVLLRSVHKIHPMHADAAHALKTLSGRGEALCVIPQNLIEFWAVATRFVTANGLGLTVNRTAQEMKKLKRAFKLHSDTAAIFSEWEKIASRTRYQ